MSTTHRVKCDRRRTSDLLQIETQEIERVLTAGQYYHETRQQVEDSKRFHRIRAKKRSSAVV